MAIQFARINIESRRDGGNACRKGAYTARDVVVDEKTGTKYDFRDRGDNVYHEMLIPEHADEKFKSTSVLMNEVERTEKSPIVNYLKIL